MDGAPTDDIELTELTDEHDDIKEQFEGTDIRLPMLKSYSRPLRLILSTGQRSLYARTSTPGANTVRGPGLTELAIDADVATLRTDPANESATEPDIEQATDPAIEPATELGFEHLQLCG